MKDKILAKLLEKYKGLSKRFLETWADKLAKKVTEEDKIEEAVNALDTMPMTMQEMAAEWQKEGDRRVTEARKPNTPAPTQEQTKEETVPDDAPDWFKKAMTPLLSEIQSLKQNNFKQDISSQIKEKLKDLNMPDVFWNKRVLPTKPEELENFVNDVKTDWESFAQTSTDAGLIVKKPEQQNAAQKNKKIDDDILAYSKEENALLSKDNQPQSVTI